MTLLLALLLSQASAEECRPRHGLPNFTAKAETDTDLKVAYLGGSITAQEGWRPKSLAHFRKTWPKARFSEINAAIGGTGSDLGVFRLKRDVLDKKPDLLLVEFAVNDGGAAREQILRCMEGIVRQTWTTLPACDIAFVYTITEQLVGPLLDGRYPKAAAAMEEVADRYSIPTIHFGVEVARLANLGKLTWKGLLKTDGDTVVFSNDGVHPYPETGHELYLGSLTRSLPKIREASKTPGPRTLPEPLIATNYERARLVPITEASVSSGFAPAEDKRWTNRLPGLLKGSAAGETLTFKFKGTRCAIYDVIGPDCGQVRVSLDGAPPRLVPRFDSFSTYHRLATLFVGTELTDEVHTVKIEIDPQPPDKAAILAKRQEKIDKPERYQGTAFYPGAILLVGELVK